MLELQILCRIGGDMGRKRKAPSVFPHPPPDTSAGGERALLEWKWRETKKLKSTGRGKEPTKTLAMWLHSIFTNRHLPDRTDDKIKWKHVLNTRHARLRLPFRMLIFRRPQQIVLIWGIFKPWHPFSPLLPSSHLLYPSQRAKLLRIFDVLC